LRYVEKRLCSRGTSQQWNGTTTLYLT
jgi:hypothetical protein